MTAHAGWASAHPQGRPQFPAPVGMWRMNQWSPSLFSQRVRCITSPGFSRFPPHSSCMKERVSLNPVRLALQSPW